MREFVSKQISLYIEQYLSKYLCGFRKGHSPQHCLVVMIEKMKMCLDNKGIAGELFTDLSKAFDCLTYDLLIAKLNSYGFSYFALKLILNYLTNRKQRTRIDATTSKWEKVQIGVPQGSIMPPPLLFNIFINDSFLFLKHAEITNYADDNTPYVCTKSLETTKIVLENEATILIRWFENNLFKINARKSHVIMTTSQRNLSVQVGEANISCTSEETLLGIIVDNKLTFDPHVK